MHKHKPKPAIFFIIIIFFVSLTLAKSDYSNPEFVDSCLTDACNINEPIIRYVHFPFLIIKNQSFPRSCGYQGFDLFCDLTNQLSIDLPNSGVFSVKAIDYANQELWLNDPDNCLAKRLLERNLLGSNDTPFVAMHEQVYWLFNCSNDDVKKFVSMKPIECLSGTNYSVVASPNEINYMYAYSLNKKCDKLGAIRVPIGLRSRGWMYNWDLSSDVRLNWFKPKCGECFQRGGQCGFKDNSSSPIGCFNLPRRGLPRSAIVALFVAFAVPLTLLTGCITYYMARAICYRRRRRNAAVNAITTPAIAPHPTVIGTDISLSIGLDRSIIETYPKVVLGESRRLPKPDDKTCPICLGEYLPRETLRTLPYCGHCFHVDCIDEWLLLNPSCPVCRNSPSPHLPQNSNEH